jgi:hypothetical protein
MDLNRNEHGIWAIDTTGDERAQKGEYVDLLASYLTAFDRLFADAQKAGEFQFILSLLAIRGLQAPGWDAFENSVRAIDAAVDMHNETTSLEGAAHLALWIYGHIVEASEPYELIANLLDVTSGGVFVIAQFPDQNGRPQSPGAKLTSIEQRAAKLGHPEVAEPLRERWDREVRNALFHSDYALHRGEVRLPSGGARRTRAQIDHLVAVANASHDALVVVRRYYIESYAASREILVGQFSDDPEERARIVVREGHGLIGLRSIPTGAPGQIAWRITRGHPDEIALLDRDPELFVLPARR